MTIVWTRHAAERHRQWEIQLGITRHEVEDLVDAPEQVVRGDEDAWVAQARRREGLLRVVYLEIGGTRKILTLYWTSRVSRYWQEGTDAGHVRR
jgi:hypothetical protein